VDDFVPRSSGWRIDMKKSLDVAAVVFASLFLLAFFVYSARGLFVPQLTSARIFGLPVADPVEALYYRVYLSRNLVIVAAGLIFLVRGQWQPLAILTTLAIALPLFDAAVLSHELGDAALLTFHIATFVVISVASALLWLRVRNTSGTAKLTAPLPREPGGA
jgi:hypothetical protein